MTTEYQPRYVAYARKHGRTPEQQLASECGMAGFMRFIAGELAAFKVARPECMCGHAITDQDAFTAFIQSRLQGL